MVSEKLVLRRKLNVEFFECLATIRRQEKTSYITSVLKLAKKHGRVSPEILRDQLLPREPLALSGNILRRHFQLGFIDESGRLTELGEEAASGNVLMPERGKYIIGVTSDPLVRSGIVYVNHAENGQQNRNSPQQNGKDKHANLKKPEILSLAIGKRSLVWLDDGIKEILVESIDEFVTPKASSFDFQLQTTIDINKTEISIKKDSGAPIRFSDNSEMDFEEVWNILVKSMGLRWRGNPLHSGEGLVRYKDTTPSERKSFSKNIPPLDIVTRSSGSFTVDPFIIKIQPEMNSDATIWAKELIRSDITEYCEQGKYKEISERVSRKFTYSSPKIPAIEEFIEYLYGPAEGSAENLPMEYWYLQAPRDLAPVVN